MTNGTLLLTEQESLFAPLGQLHYEYYEQSSPVLEAVQAHPDLQCLVGVGGLPFGSSQRPALGDYADGVNTLDFLNKKMLN
jgi:hypothetical protein